MVDEKEEQLDMEGDDNKVSWWCSMRVMFAVIGFLGCVNFYALRINLSVGIVCMVNQTAIMAETNEAPSSEWFNTTESSLTGQEGHCSSTVVKNTGHDGEFNWSKETQGLILSSFYWGYLLTQVPGGWLAQRFGGKRVIGYSMLITIIATFLTPVGARVSPFLLMTLRVIQGMGQGTLHPCMYGMWAKWAPPMERSKLVGLTIAGCQIGNVIAMPISGLLCDYGFAGGWPSIFYVFGIFSFVWFVLWMVLAYDSPDQHPRISPFERNFINVSLGLSASKSKQRYSTPWKDIFKSTAFWAIAISHISVAWGEITLISNIPTYMREVLKFDIKSNGFFSALPFLAFSLAIPTAGIMADLLRTLGMRTGTVRKLMTSVGTIPPAVLLAAAGFVSCENSYAAVGILTVAVGFSGFYYTGSLINHMDIGPPFTGVMVAITNTFGCMSGIVSNVAVGYITVDQSQAQWKIVFFIAAFIYITGTIVYCILAEGEIQEWVKPYMFDVTEDEKNGYVGSLLLLQATVKVEPTDPKALTTQEQDG